MKTIAIAIGTVLMVLLMATIAGNQVSASCEIALLNGSSEGC